MGGRTEVCSVSANIGKVQNFHLQQNKVYGDMDLNFFYRGIKEGRVSTVRKILNLIFSPEAYLIVVMGILLG